MKDVLRDLALRDGRYSPEALRFLFESLDWAVRLAGKGGAEATEESERHVSGQELLAGLRAHAEELFGPLAAQVWRSWGIHSTFDWGTVVFLLIDEELLRRRPTDTLEDFRDGFDFDAVFVDAYRPRLARDSQ